jgi:hypothetical protein
MMIMLLISFGLGMVVGASSWILATAWLESRYTRRNSVSLQSGLTAPLVPYEFRETRVRSTGMASRSAAQTEEWASG